MTNVVAFQDNNIPGTANQDIVAECEMLLAEAQSGELIGFAYCTIRNDSKGTGWTGNAGTRDAIGSAIAMLFHRYTNASLGWDGNE